MDKVKDTEGLYLILTPRITGLGGAQLYTLRRCQYLLNNGYKPIVVTYNKEGEFLLKNKFDENIIVLNSSSFKYPFYLPFVKRKIINHLSAYIHKDTKLIIESHTRLLASWGELLAIYFKGYHFIYLLDEPVPLLNEKHQYYPYVDFFRFKLNNEQLIGLSEEFVSVCFNKYLPSAVYVNIGIDTQEIPLVSYPSLHSLKNGLQDSFVIGTLCRLEKEYLLPSIYTVIEYAKKHPQKNISYIVAGGSSDKDLIKIIKSKFENQKDIQIIFTDYLSPVGADFYALLDLFIGQGTSAIYAISSQVPSIIFDRSGNNTYGFFGYHVKSFSYLYNPQNYSLEEMLDFYFSSEEIQKELTLTSGEFFKKEYLATNCFKKYNDHIDRIVESEPKYYNLNITLGVLFTDLKTFFYRKLRRFF